MKVLVPIVDNVIKDMDTPYGKSLFEIERKTILQYICESIAAIKDAEIIFIFNQNDVEKFFLDKIVHLLLPSAKVVTASNTTGGSACSCLLAIDYFQEEEPLVVVGGDQLVTISLQNVVDEFTQKEYDGGLIIFDDIHPRWSYVKLNSEGYVIEAAEKCPISRNAATGFYYFKKTRDFVESVFQMIQKGANVGGKYYVCPAYNEMVLKQKKIGVYRIDRGQYFNFNHTKGLELYEQYLKKKRDNNENSKTF